MPQELEEYYYAEKDKLIYVRITAAREAELFRQFYAGDMQARDLIFMNNLRWAAALAARRSTRRRYKPDMIAAANLGLLKAIESRRFDPAKGRFTTFATKYISGEICSVFRVACCVSFPQGQLPNWPDEKLDNGPVEDMDTLKHPEPFTPLHVDRDILREAMQSLGEPERQVLELTFFDGLTMSAAAKEIGRSRWTAHALRDMAIAKLRQILNPPKAVAFPPSPNPKVLQVRFGPGNALQEAA